MARRKFSADEDAWLLENAPHLSRKETTRLFNELFDDNRTEGVLKVHCNHQLGIKRTKATRTNSQHTRCDTKPIGAETIYNGFTFVKVTDKHLGNFYDNWELKQRVLWRQRHGEIPAKHQIIFLNRDRTDFSDENLFCISAAINAIMIKNGWYSTNREITLTAIKWCELHFALKERNENDN